MKTLLVFFFYIHHGIQSSISPVFWSFAGHKAEKPMPSRYLQYEDIIVIFDLNNTCCPHLVSYKMLV